MSRVRLSAVCIVVAGAMAFAPALAAPRQTTYSSVDLIAETAGLPAAGGTVTVALDLRPKPGWHAYWRNPGDAGKAPAIRWALPDGFEASALRFPPPKLIPFGEFVTYGFESAILLLADVSVPPGLAVGSRIELVGDADWVVCDDELCVPESAPLRLTLGVGVDGASPQAGRFAAARAALPRRVDWPARFAVADGRVEFELTPPDVEDVRSPYLFVASNRLVRYGEQSNARHGDRLRFAMAAHGRAEDTLETAAVLSYRNAQGEARNVMLRALTAGGLASTLEQPVPQRAVASAGWLAILQAIWLGLLGGVVLNLMPCVFPILSMKALGLVNLSTAHRGAARASGLLYTAGILVAFTAIALALVALRSAGAAVGWGFQLQSPLVNAGLGLVMVAIGLNLAGLFEIGTRLMGLGQSSAGGGSEKRTAFLTGLLAVVVATPCSAPFMAGALGFALAQPVAVALTIFLALGLGLALPYLVLGFVPGLARLLPRPGAWMATFRQILAFPMLATALWLFWVVGRQLGATAMAFAVLAALLLAFALWAYGRGASKRAFGWRIAAGIGLLACLLVLIRVDDFRPSPASSELAAASHTLGKLRPQRFSEDLVRQHLLADRPVFVYFTADWCISCKVNERVALATDAVGDAMTERDIAVLVGDWTAEDPAITEWLARYDRAGVPLYLYFPRGSSLATATVLPQVLLPDIVIGAIDGADATALAAS